ncbi:HNH endonuclease [Natronococcus sp. A-GB7]|uniref:HNH endonuclease n=1 Tax=Natronococcus sp. A-GB7 TaxID=3037649 RepID=UPI00241C48F0|nr:HNH endonuclease [Natronococcus sp. A-GB7]MDG5820194.1 HNH endonuclease [Natronococcus sp. A-GB7]
MSRKEDSAGPSADGPEFDVPEERGSDWTKRATEVRKRDNSVCQRCGNHNGNDEYYPLSMAAHHIVPGKYLPKADARLDLNLVTVCGTCHNRLEGAHVERQFAKTDRDEALRVLRVLKEGGQTVYTLERELDLPEERLRSLVSQLERMNCLRTRENVRYRAACPGTAWSALEKLRSELERERARRRSLEGVLEEVDLESMDAES